MLKHLRYLDISLNILGGTLFLTVGVLFFLFRLFPDHISFGFIICPTITHPIPNSIAGSIIILISILVYCGYWPSIVFGYMIALFFFAMDGYWYLQDQRLEMYWYGLAGGVVGTAYFATKLYIKRRLRSFKAAQST